jgi:lipoprotein-releasing system permease protein
LDNARPAAPFSAWERMLAFRYLKAKRKNGGVALISVLSFSAIAFAVAVLIIVMSIMNGFRSELLSRILGFNGHAFVQGEVLRQDQWPGAVARLGAAPGVIQVTPLTESQALVKGTGVAGAIVRGVSAADLRATKFLADNIKQGSLNGFGEGEYGGDLIIVGERLAANMGVAPGDPLTIVSPSGAATAFGSPPAEKTYTVGGIFSVGMSEYDQAFIYMPLEQAQLFFGKGGDIDAIEMKVENPDLMDDYLPGLRKAAGRGAVVSDWRDTNAQFFGALQVERTMMRLIMMLIVLIAGLSIIASLVMLVKNKERDIAILRTMGAGQGAIMRIFLMSGTAIGLLATPVGIGLGVLFCIYIKPIQDFVEWVTGAQVFNAAVYFLPSLPAKIDWQEVMFVSIWTFSISILMTIYPSWRASRIDPVEALRYE